MDILSRKFINRIFQYEKYGILEGHIYIQGVRLLCDINATLKKGARVKTIIFPTRSERVLFFGIPSVTGDIGKVYVSMYDIPWENKCEWYRSREIYSPLSTSWDDIVRYLPPSTERKT